MVFLKRQGLISLCSAVPAGIQGSCSWNSWLKILSMKLLWTIFSIKDSAVWWVTEVFRELHRQNVLLLIPVWIGRNKLGPCASHTHSGAPSWSQLSETSLSVQVLQVRGCAAPVPVRLVLVDVILCGTSLLLVLGQLFQEDLQLAGYIYI